MSAIKWIIAEAKKLKKQFPHRYKTWKEYVTQASAIYRSKGVKRKTTKTKVARKKIGAVRKKSAVAKKYHKDTNSHNVRVSVVSGVKRIKQIYALPSNLSFSQAVDDLKQFENNLKWHNAVLKSAYLSPNEKKKLRVDIKHTKGYIATLKNYLKKRK